MSSHAPKVTIRIVSRVALTLLALLGIFVSVAFAIEDEGGPSAKPRSGHPFLSIRVTPPSVTVAAGSLTRVKIFVRRYRVGSTTRFAAPVRLSLATRAPPGVRWLFRSNPARRPTSTLTLRTSVLTRAYVYHLLLRGVSRGQRATTSLRLTVRPSRRLAFTIAGNLGAPLAPGVWVPLNLRLTNPHPFPLWVGGVTVRVRRVIAPRADTSNPCTVSDFAATPVYSAGLWRLPPSSTWSLSSLGVASADWPRVGMLDRATSQDGCKGASVALAYAGTAVR